MPGLKCTEDPCAENGERVPVASVHFPQALPRTPISKPHASSSNYNKNKLEISGFTLLIIFTIKSIIYAHAGIYKD